MPTLASVMPSPNYQGLLNGLPVAGGKLHTYYAGTLINQTTYSDADMLVANTNPVTLDAEGKAVVFLPPGTSWKFLLKTSAGAIVPPGAIDYIVAPSNVPAYAPGAVNEFGGDPNSPIDSAAYPVGATYAECHRGTTLFVLDSADIGSGDCVIEGMIVSPTGATVTAALMNLTDAPATPMATISSASAAGELVTSGVITWPASGASKTYGIKVKSSIPSGFVWMLRLVKQ